MFVYVYIKAQENTQRHGPTCTAAPAHTDNKGLLCHVPCCNTFTAHISLEQSEAQRLKNLLNVSTLLGHGPGGALWPPPILSKTVRQDSKSWAERDFLVSRMYLCTMCMTLTRRSNSCNKKRRMKIHKIQKPIRASIAYLASWTWDTHIMIKY